MDAQRTPLRVPGRHLGGIAAHIRRQKCDASATESAAHPYNYLFIAFTHVPINCRKMWPVQRGRRGADSAPRGGGDSHPRWHYLRICWKQSKYLPSTFWVEPTLNYLLDIFVFCRRFTHLGVHLRVFCATKRF